MILSQIAAHCNPFFVLIFTDSLKIYTKKYCNIYKKYLIFYIFYGMM